MSQIRILTERMLRDLIPLDRTAIDCVADGFRALAAGGVVMPPILRLDMEENNGEVDVKTAYVPGLESFALKVSPGFFDNPKLGLPSLNGLMNVFSARTGLVEALLLDNGYLTAVRTAAAGAVAAEALSRKDARTVAILGAGEQGRLQLEALTMVRDIRRAVYWSRRPEQAEETAAEMAKRLDMDISALPDAAAAVKDADIIITCTPSTSPVLTADMISSGQHITAMGSDAEHKNELDPAILTRADAYIPDSLAQVRRLGELHHALEAGLFPPDASFSELGAVISGKAAGRGSDTDITVADLTGTGVQDTAIATLAVNRARKADAGILIDSDAV